MKFLEFNDQFDRKQFLDENAGAVGTHVPMEAQLAYMEYLEKRIAELEKKLNEATIIIPQAKPI